MTVGNDLLITPNLIGEAQSVLSHDPELLSLSTEISVDAAGSYLGRRAEPQVDNLSGSPLWPLLLDELFLLVCKKDKKYAELRRQIEATDKVVKQGIIPAVAGVVGARLGVEVAIVTPFVALGFLGLAELGINAWCAGNIDRQKKFVGSDGKAIKLKARDL